jgi:hypothetical protein
MGANVSTQISTVTTTLNNAQKNNCRNESSIDQSIGNINVNLVGANCGTIEFSNQATVSQMCDLSGAAKSLAEAAQGLTAEQKSTLSLSANVSTGVQDNTTTINTILENECGNSQKIKQKISGANITLQPYVSPDGKTMIPASCDILRFANSASAQQQCILKTVSDSLAKIDQKQAAKQVTEFPPLLSGMLMFLLLPAIGIGVIIFIIVIIKMLKPKDQGMAIPPPGGKTGATGTSMGASGANVSGLFQQGMSMFSKGKSGTEKKFGGAKLCSAHIRTENIPIVVLGILMLVWYAKMTDPRR